MQRAALLARREAGDRGGQPGGSSEPARSVTTVTRSGSISAGLSSTVPCGSCSVSRQVSSLIRCSPSPAAASSVSCSSSGGATVAVGSSATDSTSSRGSRPSARIRRTVSSSAYGSGTPPLSAGVGTWKTGRPSSRAYGAHQAAQGLGTRTSPSMAAVRAVSRAGAPGGEGRAAGGGGQSAPLAVPAGRVEQGGAAADRFGPGAGGGRREHPGQFRQHRQPVVGERRSEADRAVAFRIRPHRHLRAVASARRRRPGVRSCRPRRSQYPGPARREHGAGSGAPPHRHGRPAEASVARPADAPGGAGGARRRRPRPPSADRPRPGRARSR